MIRFVTGTDTDVGKTVVTAALAVRAPGRVAVVKPAQTGVGPAEPGDLDAVRRLAGVTTVEGCRVPAPLAPPTAARVAGIALPSLTEQTTLVEGVVAEHDEVLVEGSGGVRVLLGADWDLTGLALALAGRGHEVEVVVVVRAGLGTLNHTVLTVDHLRDRGLAVAGLVVGSWPADPGLAERCNLVDLPAQAGVPVLGRVPAGAGGWTAERFRAAAPGWFR